MCDCFNAVLKNVEEKLKPKKGILDWEADWQNRVLRFDGGFGIGLKVEYEYRNIKKDGTPFAKKNKSDCFIALSFCPFCGKSLK